MATVPAVEKPNELSHGSRSQGMLLLLVAEDPLAIRLLNSPAIVTNDFYHDLTLRTFEPAARL